MGYLISETTREEREKIVADSLGYIDATCDGCMSGLVDMYQDYIDGKRELRDINMAFHAGYISGYAGYIGEKYLDTAICVKYNTAHRNK